MTFLADIATPASAWASLIVGTVSILILLVLSGTFSCSETVLFSLTPVQLERAAASTNPLRRLVAQLMRRPKQALVTVLVANTAVNVLLFANAYVLFDDLASRFGDWLRPVAAIACVLLVVVFGEVVPKTLGVSMAERLAPFAAAIVRVAGIGARPVAAVLDVAIAEPITRLAFGPRPSHRAVAGGLSRAELKTLLEMSRRRGAIMPLEDDFLRAIIDLGHTRVRDVMVPRVEIAAYDVNASPQGLRELMRATRHKKIPVHDGSRDNIVGVIYAKVLFLNPGRPLRELVQPVRFVPDLATCEQLLTHFRETKTQFAIAIDEFGGVAGLVTLEDVLEEIVGELYAPEDEVEAPDVRAEPDGAYDISGQLSVHYWIEMFNLPARVERVATVGGLVMAQLGRPARPGDRVRLGNVELEVTGVRRRRIDRLRLRLLDPPEGAEAPQ